MQPYRHTKIIATLGPASSCITSIDKLIKSGVDVFRLNFSHGDHETHRKNIEMIRHLEPSPLGIFMDLQGPKLRIGTFIDPEVYLKKGQIFYLDCDDSPGNSTRVQFPHPEIYKSLAPDLILRLDDGRVHLRVLEVQGDRIVTQVDVPGSLSHHKGVNIPGVCLPMTALTKKDRHDLKFGLENNLKMVALSFVQRPEDIQELRDIVGDDVKIIAKLEKPQVLDCLDDIMELSDAVMVARGDLGVEMPAEDVPVIQKRIVKKARQVGKPVIIATQMLDSMVSFPSPTRAEASDVATAVYDGVDAVMLSGESAAGKYPAEAVIMMSRIINRVEQDPDYFATLQKDMKAHLQSTSADAVTYAAKQMSETLNAKAIVTFTRTGSTSLRAARVRPGCIILALTPDPTTARMLALVWGVKPRLVGEMKSDFDMRNEAVQAAKVTCRTQPGDIVVLTAGMPNQLKQKGDFLKDRTTNMVRIITV